MKNQRIQTFWFYLFKKLRLLHLTAQSSILRQVRSNQTLSHSFHNHRRSVLNKVTLIPKVAILKQSKTSLQFCTICITGKLTRWKKLIYRIFTYVLFIPSCIYNIYILLHVQYIHTYIYIYTEICQHYNNYSLNLKLITHICFPEAFKSLNVQCILY